MLHAELVYVRYFYYQFKIAEGQAKDVPTDAPDAEPNRFESLPSWLKKAFFPTLLAAIYIALTTLPPSWAWRLAYYVTLISLLGSMFIASILVIMFVSQMLIQGRPL